MSEKVWSTEKGKLTVSRRFNLLPLLPSGSDGVQRELSVRDLPFGCVSTQAKGLGSDIFCLNCGSCFSSQIINLILNGLVISRPCFGIWRPVVGFFHRSLSLVSVERPGWSWSNKVYSVVSVGFFNQGTQCWSNLVSASDI